MTAAGLAEQAAVDRLEADRKAGHRLDRAHARDAADAATQVWAPILRALVEHHGHTGECNVYHGWRDTSCDCGHDAALKAAKKALG